MSVPIKGLEPLVQDFADLHKLPLTTSDMMGLSIAISAKRIADTLDNIAADMAAGTDRMGFLGRLHETIGDALKQPINQYGEGIGEAISGQLERSQR